MPTDEEDPWEEVHTLKLGLGVLNSQGIDSVHFKDVKVGVKGAERIVKRIRIRNHSLRRINLNNAGLADDGALVILDYLLDPACKLEVVKLAENSIEEIAITLAKVFMVNHVLEELDLSSNNIDGSTLEPISHGFGSLQKLDISENALGDAGVTFVSSSLRTSRTLQWLGLNSVGAKRDGFVSLCAALKENNSLEQLHIAGNELDMFSSTRLAKALKKNKSLSILNVGSNGFSDHSAYQLFQLLKTNNTVAELNVANNGIDESVCEDIEPFLSQNSSVRNLNFANNAISNKGAQILCRALIKNTTLTVLNLSMNKIADLGAKAVGKLLERDTALKELALSGNKIKAYGAKAIAEALKKNHTLQILDLSKNELKDEGAEYISDSLKVNSSLTSLNINDNSIDISGLRELMSSLKTNKSIIHIQINAGPRTAMDKQLSENYENRQLLAKEMVLTAIQRIDSVNWNRSKLMVVGQEGSGKTSLIRSILGKGFASNIKATQGVETFTLRKKYNEDRWIKVHGNKTNTRDFEHIVLRAGASKMKHARSQLNKDHKSLRLSNLRKVIEITGEKSKGDDAMRNESTTAPLQSRLLNEKEVDQRFKKHLVRDVFEPEESFDDYEHHPLTFMVWDYGGQPVFYPLHHLFLTEKGMYLLVFDLLAAYKELDQANSDVQRFIRFWVNSIILHAKNAPVIIAGTRCDQIEQAKLEAISKALKRLPELQKVDLTDNGELCFFPVDNRTKTGIELLQNTIESTARRSDYIKEEVPLRWIRCFDRMIEEQDNYWMKLEDVKRIAQSCDVNTAKEVREMLNLLNKLGVVIYLDATESLRSYVIIHPQWIINKIAKILDPNDSQQQLAEVQKSGLEQDWLNLKGHGIVSRSLLEFFWEPKEVDFLIDLFERALLMSLWTFKKVASAKEQFYLVPSLLPACEDKFKEFKKVNKRLILDFNKFFLPIGVFERLLCLAIGYSSRQVNIPEPSVSSDYCKIWLGSSLPITMLCMQDDDKIAVSIGEENADPARSITIVLSMMMKLKEDIMGEEFVWEEFYETGSLSLTPTEAAKHKAFKSWISGEIKALKRQNSMDLHVFLELL